MDRYTQYNSSLYLLARQVEEAVRNVTDCDLTNQVDAWDRINI